MCCFAALHLFDDPETALASFARVPRPGGHLALLTTARRPGLRWRPFDTAVGAVSGMRMFDRGEVSALLRARGFTDVSAREQVSSRSWAPGAAGTACAPAVVRVAVIQTQVMSRLHARPLALLLLLALLVPISGCSSEEPAAGAVVRRVPPGQWQRMVDVGMVRPECPIRRRDQLRRVEVNHYDFQGDIERGHLVVNVDVAHSVARIFTRLFEEEFPIRRMRSLEAYGGDSNASLAADNTAAFNCRRANQINAPFMESPHANGRAVDINPRENPWMDLRCDCWQPGKANHRRTPGKGKILREGMVWRVFREEGWIWQDIDVADYMHFDTGYPSRPYDGPPPR